jgi:uncharacterized protein (DUF1810 family)
MDDPFDLQRFVDAQERVYGDALAELRAGRKESHWIWFVLPQLRGLGRSANAEYYGLGGLAEARAYLAHPVLGPRLRETIDVLLDHADLPASLILGPPDDMKFRSCLTLFARADPAEARFQRALEAFFGGRPDGATLRLLGDGDS